jgi:glycerol-3-phosphate acyltransferase PlsX
MDDIPVAALRRKPDSSMRSSLNLVKTQEATACVSAGNTGALMVIAKYVLRTLPGIDRPAILYPMPSKDKAVSVLDLGANIECSPEQLFQFAVMGSVLVSALENKDDPTIGLLNIGSEAIKGTEVIKTASKLIADCKDLNYYGFVEGNDIYKATVDVVVCDGFIGNVTLKVSEGLAKLIVQYVKQGFMATWWTKLIAWLAKPILQGIFNKVNPSKYNGASLLGLNGVVIKSHGGADALAFCSAITAAFMGAKKNIPLLIREKVALYLQDYQKV